MLPALALATALAATPAAPPPNPYVRGLDAPVRRVVRTIGTAADVTPPAPIVRRCDAYPAHAVLWTENPALQGVVDVEVRARAPGTSPEQACAPTVKGGRRFEESDQVYDPIGAIGRHLV